MRIILGFRGETSNEPLGNDCPINLVDTIRAYTQCNYQNARATLSTAKYTFKATTVRVKIIESLYHNPPWGPPGTYQAKVLFYRLNYGYNNILTAIDSCSRYVLAKPSKSESDTALSITRLLAQTDYEIGLTSY
ncbi:hypothetical protein CHS0354_019108 [Potamilus streckersoni]|uniref:Uncharacterized protein n=1 Tax=Potamilus streckersoni TaxID=2493646 RepID=A0AAE0RR49_9BIVA|nr:hypothetical protein CHS0354_019108 [Potamilus streckersoni]